MEIEMTNEQIEESEEEKDKRIEKATDELIEMILQNCEDYAPGVSLMAALEAFRILCLTKTGTPENAVIVARFAAKTLVECVEHNVKGDGNVMESNAT
jgi:hypothetical protein